jgi:acyl-CoA reductase-like NAD-dependent aldehyde dehydrogenase
MKKIIIVLGILVAANVLVAQEREMLERRKDDFKQLMNLSEGQSDQLEKLHEKYRPEFQNIRNDASKTKSEKLRESADLIDARNEELQNILSAEQYAKLEIIKEVRAIDRKRKHHRVRERMKNRRN